MVVIDIDKAILVLSAICFTLVAILIVIGD